MKEIAVTPNSLKTLLLISLLACCFFTSAQAVSPPPDGGYPGGNTAEGQSALLNLTSGTYDTAVGYFSLLSNATSSFNTAIGAGALLANTADQNTATGAGTLLSNTTGRTNTADGTFALFSNTTGSNNTAVGNNALLVNTTGGLNTAVGNDALSVSTTGNGNTGVGLDALATNTTGNNNTGIGINALFGNTTGNNNIALGSNSGANITSADNVICIGTDGNNVSNSCYIGQIFNNTSSGGTAVFINSNGRLGTATSSRRFKDDIRPMDKASEAIMALKPVAFRYKKEIDATGTSQFGLVAEDVEKVNPDLIVRDKEGKPYSVRYEQVNAMLLNEFLKEHETVQAQQATISRLEKQVEALAAGLQKVNAELATKPTLQTASR